MSVGYDPDEVITSEPTRSARLKWVIVVDETLPPGRQVNATACVAAATAVEVAGLLGPSGTDADGWSHPGLPWAGCSILAASPAQLALIRAGANTATEVFAVDMPAAAQSTRVYDDYLARLGETPSLEVQPFAISLIGPRKDVDRLVKRLSLLP